MERIRYVPIGWSKYYEFSEADLRCSLEVADQYIANNNVSQETLISISSVIANNIYGGKIDNDFDLNIMISLVK